MPQMWQHGPHCSTRGMGSSRETAGLRGPECRASRAGQGQHQQLIRDSDPSRGVHRGPEAPSASCRPAAQQCGGAGAWAAATTRTGGEPPETGRCVTPCCCSGRPASLARGSDVEVGALGGCAGRGGRVGGRDLGRLWPIIKRLRRRGNCGRSPSRSTGRPRQPAARRKAPATPRSPLPACPHQPGLHPPYLRDGRRPNG